MNSVLNIEPNNIIVKSRKNHDDYHFLDFINKDHNLDIETYYSLLNSMESFKLKNIYNFIYLRIYKLRKLGYNLRELQKIDKKINGNELERFLSEYINDQILYSIIIMNAIQLYFYP